MSFPERLVTAEYADETIRRNSFEDRLLQRRLDDIEKNAAKRKRKIATEQLSYAMENLSLEDASKFTSLTRKILLSNLLPPLNRPETGPSPGRQENDTQRNEPGEVPGRVRGTTITHRDSGSCSGPRQQKLTRSFSFDSCLLPVIDSKGKRTVGKDFYQVRNKEKIAFPEKRVVKSFSLSEVEECDFLNREQTKISGKPYNSHIRKLSTGSNLPRRSDKTSPERSTWAEY